MFAPHTKLGRNRVPLALLEGAKDRRIDQAEYSPSACLIDSSSSSQGTVCDANATKAAVVKTVSQHLTQYELHLPPMAATLGMRSTAKAPQLASCL
jgi:hypothetical protein